MAGLKVVPVKSLPDGSLDHKDLCSKAEKHQDNLAAFMVLLFNMQNIVILTQHIDHLPFNVRRV